MISASLVQSMTNDGHTYDEVCISLSDLTSFICAILLNVDVIFVIVRQMFSAVAFCLELFSRIDLTGLHFRETLY